MADAINSNRHPPNAGSEGVEGTRRRPLSRDDLKAYALSQLGFPIVQVEVDDTQMGVLIEALLDVYNRQAPIFKSDVLTGVSPTINKYNLLELKKPFGRGVVNASVATKDQFFSPISGVFALGIPHPITHLSPDEYELAGSYIRSAEKIYSAEPEWKWEEPVLWLHSPTGFGGPFTIAYDYVQDCQVEDIPQSDHYWAKKYFLSQVRVAVGEARAKFGGIPGPAGQSLRGENMIQQGIDEMTRLEEELRDRHHMSVPPIWLGR